ncbi:vWA domain-containing protein [Stratiformator vulcanicus]|uniref:VWFA domain-containing protein n=1 Tax=Stratiformator vulcanicus TaxID=2527980 RepID=A0A517R080_9PLAN|nr:vWA domain-containing protein [Stratiformator vulcanicus]QDT37307.1 hypothetical protein Pan189_16800 [Stratiformator vulcanicus]
MPKLADSIDRRTLFDLNIFAQLQLVWDGFTPIPAMVVFGCVTALLLLVLGRTVALAGFSRRALSLLVVRAAAIIVLGFIAILPQLAWESDRMPRVAILIDSSKSMSLRDVNDGTRTRHAAAIDFMKGVSNHPRLAGSRFFVFADAVREVSLSELEFDNAKFDIGTRSRIAGAIQNVKENSGSEQPDLVIVLSDGIETDSESETSELAKPLDETPIAGVLFGSDKDPPNLSIEKITSPRTVLSGVDFEVLVEWSAVQMANVDFEIAVFADSNEKPITSKVVTIRSDNAKGNTSLEIPHLAEETQDFEIRVKSIGKPEFLMSNNQRSFRVSRFSEPLKVLLTGEFPSWEFRRLKGLLKNVSGIELTIYLASADQEYAASDASVVESLPDNLQPFDVVVLTSGPTAFFQHGLSKVVASGTGVVEMDTSKELLTSNRSTLEITPIGRQILNLRPRDYLNVEIQSSSKDEANLETGELVLFRTTGRSSSPVLTVRQTGESIVLSQYPDRSWRLLAAADRSLYERYWHALIEFAAQSHDLERPIININHRLDQTTGESVFGIEDRRIARTPSNLLLNIVDPAGKKSQVELATELSNSQSRMSTRVGPLPGGHYSAWVGSRQGLPGASAVFSERIKFRVAPTSTELTRLAADRSSLAAMADASGGRFFTDSDSEAFHSFIDSLEIEKQRESIGHSITAYSLLLAAFVAFLLIERRVRLS